VCLFVCSAVVSYMYVCVYVMSTEPIVLSLSFPLSYLSLSFPLSPPLSSFLLQTATALEVCAGGRLYNVVVDTQQTGKLLLQRGKLKRRVTIIPLNKIARKRLRAEVIFRAHSLSTHDCLYSENSSVCTYTHIYAHIHAIVC